MNFYQPHSQFYCGVDLHSSNMYLCVIDRQQNKILHKNIKNQQTDVFLKLLEPYKNDLVLGCESTYAWYWFADLCFDNNIEFILGHTDRRVNPWPDPSLDQGTRLNGYLVQKFLLPLSSRLSQNVCAVLSSETPELI